MTKRPDIGAMFSASATETFLGLPRAGDLGALEAGIVILGAPCATPYRSVGPYCAGAPHAIRDAIAGYAANLHHVDFDLGGPIFPDGLVAVDGGDLACTEADPSANRAESWLKAPERWPRPNERTRTGVRAASRSQIVARS